MTVAYATSDEYVEETGRSAPADIDRLLERASELLDSIVTATFDLDEVTELPTDGDTAAALRRATCFQVEFWERVGEENDIDGLAGSQVAIGHYQGRRSPIVAPRAKRILRGAGLIGGQR